MTKIGLLSLVLAFLSGAPLKAQQFNPSLSTVRCFFQNGVTNFAQSYWGNSVTHDNTHQAQSSETTFPYYGNNAMIFDGPVVHIGTSCLLTSVTYMSGPSPNTDPYKLHYVCVGTGLTDRQGDTNATKPATAGGKCATGDSDYTCTGNTSGCTNMYDVGLYCVSNTTGECTFGQLYCNIGPVPNNVAAPSTLTVVTFQCKQGQVTLPVGDYGVMMGTNCDNGSVPAPNGMGATYGTGGGNCLTGQGEGGAFGTGGTTSGTYQWASQLYAWKYFTFPAGTGGPVGGHCLLFDPFHDNTVSLPPTLTSYDITKTGGCSLIHLGKVDPMLLGVLPGVSGLSGPPHALGFTWWSNI